MVNGFSRDLTPSGVEGEPLGFIILTDQDGTELKGNLGRVMQLWPDHARLNCKKCTIIASLELKATPDPTGPLHVLKFLRP